MKEKKLYHYRGPVCRFERCVCNVWEGYTYSTNEINARKNLAQQYKKQNNLMPTANVSVPGKIEIFEREENEEE